jgi:hypothetical protein
MDRWRTDPEEQVCAHACTHAAAVGIVTVAAGVVAAPVVVRPHPLKVSVLAMCVCVCYDSAWAHLLLRPHLQAKLRNNVRNVLEGMFEKFEEVPLQAMFR